MLTVVAPPAGLGLQIVTETLDAWGKLRVTTMGDQRTFCQTLLISSLGACICSSKSPALVRIGPNAVIGCLFGCVLWSGAVRIGVACLVGAPELLCIRPEALDLKDSLTVPFASLHKGCTNKSYFVLILSVSGKTSRAHINLIRAVLMHSTIDTEFVHGRTASANCRACSELQIHMQHTLHPRPG
jgi:hypothetical protein